MRDMQPKPSWKTSKAGGGGGSQVLLSTSTAQHNAKQYLTKAKALPERPSKESTSKAAPDDSQPINYSSTSQTFLNYGTKKETHIQSVISDTTNVQRAAESILTQIEMTEASAGQDPTKTPKNTTPDNTANDQNEALPGCSTSEKPEHPPTTSAQGKFHDFSIEYILSQNM